MKERLKRGEFKNMSPEKQKEWKRYLQKRWRSEHKEVMKKENKYWYDLYRKTKPYKCICKRCGKEFDSPRPYYVLCGKCPSQNELEKRRIAEKKRLREERKNAAVKMYLTGKYSQQQVAEHFGTIQKQISLWVNEYKNTCKIKRKHV